MCKDNSKGDSYNGHISWKRLYHGIDETLLYEGFTYKGKPYGPGTVFFPNGQKYQEGLFSTKGLTHGIEYYPNGQIRFDGVWRRHTAYGPNPPIYGKYYTEDGECIHNGVVQLRTGGVGYPTVVVPNTYGNIVQNERPDIEYLSYAEYEELSRTY